MTSQINRWGLNLFRPRLRLLIVIVLTSAFVFIYSINAAIFTFLGTIVVLILTREIKFKKLLYVLLITNSLYMFAGNYLFSPENCGGSSWFVFQFNTCGIFRGIVGALKRNAMIALSFSWLSVTSIPDIYESLSFFRPARKFLTVFLRQLQRIQVDYAAIYHSLVIRGFSSKRWELRKRINFLRITLVAVLLRIFNSVGKLTYAGENHFLSSGGNGESEIVVRDLSVRYGTSEKLALANINLKVGQGEFVFIAGKDRSGKSTLLRAISGYIPRIIGYLMGDIYVGGDKLRPHDSLQSIAQKLRFIIDNPADSIIGLTVKQELLSIIDDEALARKSAIEMGIEHLWERETITLSGGELSRLSLSVILLSRTQVVLLDSPLSQLDERGRRAFIQALTRLREKNRPTVLVSDNRIDLFSPLIERLILLENGRIVKDVSVNENTYEAIISRAGLGLPNLSVCRCDTSEEIARLNNVYVERGGNQVISGINFSLHRADFVAVLGANGSGKTTLMLALAGVLSLRHGTIDVRGRVGYVFQNSALQIVEMSVEKELNVGPTLLGWDENKRYQFVSEQLAWLRLYPDQETINLHPADLRRLAVSCMRDDVQILVLDEPTSDLDSEAVAHLFGLIDELVKSGLCVVLITHDERIAGYAHRYVILRSGRIIKDTRDYAQALSTIYNMECE